MIVSHLHRFIFVAVPKTGTHSVRQALRAHMGPDDMEQARLFVEKQFPIPELARLGHGHLSFQDVRPHLGEAAFAGYFKFAFVRNPFDRFISYCSFATSREGTLTGTISVIVTEVLPNGDLRIEGRREVTVNSEKQLMTIGGIVRRVDVDTKNTVLSSAIADAKIEYAGLGVLDDVQRAGWFVRILDWIYPF